MATKIKLRKCVILYDEKQLPDTRKQVLLVAYIQCLVVPWLRRLVDGLSLRRPGFATVSVCVGFMVDDVALWQIFLLALRFSPVSIFQPVLHTHVSPGGWTVGPLVAAV
jgi:hypothetical protein